MNTKDHPVSSANEAARIAPPVNGAAHDDSAVERGIEVERDPMTGAPVPYATGTQSFMGLDFLVEHGVVVPRSVTARVGRAALQQIERMRREGPERSQWQMVDMCTGAGNLACALAHSVPGSRVWACDLMPPCCALTRKNAERLGLGHSVATRCGDLFQALAGDNLEGKIDLIVCAPPFISTGRLDKDRAYLLAHEPREAFDAGPYGIAIHQRVIKDARAFLRPGGALVFEVGEGQAKQVARLFERTGAYDSIRVVDEGDGLEVVVEARMRIASAPQT
jgi:release factor glutamine methyltransferase